MINDLTVDDSSRKDLKIQQLEDEKTKIEKQLPALVNEAVERIKQELMKEGYMKSSSAD